MSVRPSGTVAFLFSDIEGSTALWEADPAAMRDVLAGHDELVAAVVDAHGGVVFASMGDGIGAAFARAGDAVAAAVEIQRLLVQDTAPGGGRLRVRLGVHTGEAQERDGNYFGPTVNRAARLMAAAHGGQIVVSEVTAGLLPIEIGVETVDLGSHRLAGISEPMRVFAIRADGVPWVDRALRSLTVGGNLPVSVSRFVGRDVEIGRLAEEVTTRALITLTGTAGVGKTRLAVEVARSVVASFPDGAWIVELAPVIDPDAVVHAVVEALGLSAQSARPLDAIVAAVRDRRLLLVLDNCEHVRDAAAALVTRLVAAAPGVRVLATSREPLGVPGELVRPVRPLDATGEAVELFCDRAAMADPDFQLDADGRSTVERVCVQLDGIPLAIELAAARTRVLSLSELSERLDDRFRRLHTRMPGAPARHQTLEAAIDWSYQLLDEHERRLFDRLSVFVGGFDRIAAQRVCGFDPVDPDEVDDVLASLIDRSMVQADRSEPVTRHSLLESLRQFGQLRLDERAETGDVRNRHVRHYVAHARHADHQWHAPGDNHASDLFAREWDNLRTAHSWAVTNGDVDNAVALAMAITPWAVNAGTRPEVGDWVARTLNLAEDNALLSPELLGIASVCRHVIGDEEGSEYLADTGIRLAAEPLAGETAWCWFSRTSVSVFLGRADTAVDDALALLQALDHAGDPFDFVLLGCYTLAVLHQDLVAEQLARLDELAAPLANPAIDASKAYASLLERWRLGDLDAAMALNDGVVSLARRAGNGQLVFNTIWMRIVVSIERGQEDPRVPRALRQLLDRMRYVPYPWTHRWWMIDAIAGYLSIVGAAEPAAVLIGVFNANRQGPNVFLTNVHAQTTERIDAEAAVGDWLARGAGLSPDDAFAYAEQQLEATLSQPSDAGGHLRARQA